MLVKICNIPDLNPSAEEFFLDLELGDDQLHGKPDQLMVHVEAADKTKRRRHESDHL